MASSGILLSCLCAVLALGLVRCEDRSGWDVAKYEEEYNKLKSKMTECQEVEDNPSLISWEEAETALFLIVAVLVVLVLFVLILLMSWCGLKKELKKQREKEVLAENGKF